MLPLFPLNTVLFPDAMIPVHIFEERYRLMIQRCLDGDSEFGVVLIRSGSEVGEPAEPHSVGTVARIIDVQQLDQGRMRIAVAGRERFRIDAITQKRPHMEGQVAILREEGEVTLSATEMDAVREAAAQQVRLMHGLSGGWVWEPNLPDEAAALSYFIAVLLQVGNDEKQALLEESSTAARLRAELLLMEREAEALKERVAQELGGRRHSKH